ncbi:MAG: cytochrome c oxidase subunit 3 [Clostridia bacterium]|nr:cytochrome c oxidase subunit 3 [Clostridia bacterium]
MHGQEGPVAVPEGLRPGSLPESRVFGFWVFLAGEATLFASLIGTFLALRGQTAGGPGPEELFDLPLVFAATVALLTSSLTGALATRQLKLGRLSGVQAWLAVTIVLGEIFLGIQAYEFYHYMMTEGFGLGTSAYSAGFYTLVGFHGMHVSFGVFWLIGHLFNSFLKRGISEADAAKIFVAGLYWHFVDVVWVLIFSVVYLMGKLGV